MLRVCQNCEQDVDDYVICVSCETNKLLCLMCGGVHYRSKHEHLLLTPCHNRIHECSTHRMIASFWCDDCRNPLCFQCFVQPNYCRHESKTSVDSRICSIRQDIHNTIRDHEEVIKNYKQQRSSREETVQRAIRNINIKVENIISEIKIVQNEAIDALQSNLKEWDKAIEMAEEVVQTAQNYLDYENLLSSDIDLQSLKTPINYLPETANNETDLELPRNYLHLVNLMDYFFSDNKDYGVIKPPSNSSDGYEVMRYAPSLESIEFPNTVSVVPNKVAVGSYDIFTAESSSEGHSLKQYSFKGEIVSNSTFHHKEIRCMCCHGEFLLIATCNNLWSINVSNFEFATETMLMKHIRIPCIASNNVNVVFYSKDFSEILLLNRDLSIKMSVNIGFKICSGGIAISQTGNIWTLQEKEIHVGNCGRKIIKYSSELRQLQDVDNFSRTATLAAGVDVVAVFDKRVHVYNEKNKLIRQVKCDCASIVRVDDMGFVAISKKALKFVKFNI